MWKQRELSVLPPNKRLREADDKDDKAGDEEEAAAPGLGSGGAAACDVGEARARGGWQGRFADSGGTDPG